MSVPVDNSQMFNFDIAMLKGKINNMDFENLTTEDIAFLKKVTFAVRNPFEKAKLMAIRPEADRGKKLAEAVQNLVNQEFENAQVKSMKKEVTMTPEPDDPLKAKRIMEKLRLTAKPTPLRTRRTLDKSRLLNEEEIEKIVGEIKPNIKKGTKVTVENDKPAVIVGEEMKSMEEVPRTVQPTTDSVHNEVHTEQFKGPQNEGKLITPEERLKHDIITFSSEAGKSVLDRARAYMNYNNPLPSMQEFSEEVAKEVTYRLGNNSANVSDQLKLVLENTTSNYISNFVNFQDRTIATIATMQQRERENQNHIIGGMLSMINDTTNKFNMQLTEYLNKGAAAIQNILYEGQRERDQMQSRVYDMITKQQEKNDQLVEKLHTDNMNTVKEMKKDSEIRMSELTDKIVSISNENNSLQKEIINMNRIMNETVNHTAQVIASKAENMSQMYMNAMQVMVDRLTDIIKTQQMQPQQVQSKTEREDKFIKYHKEKDENVISENFVTNLVNTFKDIAKDSNATTKYTTQRAFDQNETFGSKIISNENQMQNNIFNTMNESIRQPREDPTSHSASKTVSPGGHSLREAFGLFKEAQSLAKDLLDKDRVTVSEFRELSEKISNLKMNDEAVEQGRANGYDFSLISAISEMLQQILESYGLDKGREPIKEDDHDMIEVVKDKLDEFKDGIKRSLIQEQNVNIERASEGNGKGKVKLGNPNDPDEPGDDKRTIDVPYIVKQSGPRGIAEYLYNKSEDFEQLFYNISLYHNEGPAYLVNLLFSGLSNHDTDLADAFEEAAKKRDYNPDYIAGTNMRITNDIYK